MSKSVSIGKFGGFVFGLVFGCVAAFGQMSFQGLTPGSSTRNDVEQALGQPVQTFSKFEFEYKAPAGVAKVEVAYSGSSVKSSVNLIRVYFVKPITRAALIQKLSLPQKPDAVTTSRDGKLEELYGGQALLAMVYENQTAAAGVRRVVYCSRPWYENTLAQLQKGPVSPDQPVVRPGNEPAPAVSAERNPATPGGSSTAAGVGGFSPRLDNTTLLGGTNIRRFEVNSIDECENACAANTQCRGYVLGKQGARPYSKDNNVSICVLKSDIGYVGHNPCCMSSIRNR